MAAPPMYRAHLWALRFPPRPDPKKYSYDTRPDASGVPVGTWIYNTDDNAPQYSDGTYWRDAEGRIT